MELGATRSDPDFDPLLDWLRTDESLRVAQRCVRRVGLPPDFAHDIRQDAYLTVLRRPPQPAPDNVAAYGTRILRNKAIDLTRALDRREGRTGDTEPAELDEQPDLKAPSPEELTAHREAMQALRQTLPLVGGATIETVAAALTILSVEVDGAAPGAGCPVPTGGQGAEGAARWAGLYYAGLTDLVGDGDGRPVASSVRRQRGRVISRVDTLLRTAWERIDEDPRDA